MSSVRRGDRTSNGDDARLGRWRNASDESPPPPPLFGRKFSIAQPPPPTRPETQDQSRLDTAVFDEAMSSVT